MGLVTLNEKSFEPAVSANGIVMVDCWAGWCSACKTFARVYERVARKHPDHTFGKLNTEREKGLVAKLGIEHIPTLLLYRDGILLFQKPGYFEEEQLEDIVTQAESLDMNVVRSEIAAEKDGQKSDNS